MAKVDLYELFAVHQSILAEKAMAALNRGCAVALHSEKEGCMPIDGSVIIVSHPNDFDACLQQAEENAQELGGSDVWIEEIFTPYT